MSKEQIRQLAGIGFGLFFGATIFIGLEYIGLADYAYIITMLLGVILIFTSTILAKKNN